MMEAPGWFTRRSIAAAHLIGRMQAGLYGKSVLRVIRWESTDTVLQIVGRPILAAAAFQAARHSPGSSWLPDGWRRLNLAGSKAEFDRIRAYIEENQVSAGLVVESQQAD